jgi:uncharacterized protein YecE (DUF72 family)
VKQVHVGTSGWHYPHWKGPFYPEGIRDSEMLSYYAQLFNIVELNNTFYKLPDQNVVVHWRENSPKQFQFAVKGSRYLTHMKKLKDPVRGLERFFSRAELLGPKLGPILFQLPPHWSFDEARFSGFLDSLPSGHRYAFEFRDASWNNATSRKLLSRFNAAYCIFNLAGFQSPAWITADFTYIRLHGPNGRYQGSYRQSELRGWVKRLKEWSLNTAYVFFDNDQAAYAVKNALLFQTLIR